MCTNLATEGTFLLFIIESIYNSQVELNFIC